MASYTVTGPVIGQVGSTSMVFTVTRDSTILGEGETMVVTPSDNSGGGAFSPTTVNITDLAPTATFRYTPATAGKKTISTTNNKARTNPAAIIFASMTSLPDLINKCFLVIDAAFGGVFEDALVNAGLTRAELNVLKSVYATYKTTASARTGFVTRYPSVAGGYTTQGRL